MFDKNIIEKLRKSLRFKKYNRKIEKKLKVQGSWNI